MSRDITLVELRGFEPLTPSMRMRMPDLLCAGQLGIHNG